MGIEKCGSHSQCRPVRQGSNFISYVIISRPHRPNVHLSRHPSRLTHLPVLRSQEDNGPRHLRSDRRHGEGGDPVAKDRNRRPHLR